MDIFKSLENSSSVLIIEDKEYNDEEILDNIFKKIKNDHDFINDIINDIVNNSIINIIKSSKFERAELKLLNKIYSKFNLKKNIDTDEIDIVYTYINYNDREFMMNKSSLEINNIDRNLLNNYKSERRDMFNEFILNIEVTKKNLPFIRNVYILTPTPDAFEEIKNYIIVPIEFICGKDKFVKDYFRPNNVVKYLVELKSLSKVFLYGTSEMIVVKEMRKDDFFVNGVPVVYMGKRNFEKEDYVNNMEEYNTSILFESKFDILFKACNINQLTLVRKDVVSFARSVFKDDLNIDFLLLQYFLGYFFYLYDLKTSNRNNYGGFYSNVSKYAIERFNMIKTKKVNFFHVNHLTNKLVPYYLHSCLVNLNIIDKRTVKYIYFLFNDKKYRYLVSSLERMVRNNVEESVIFRIVDKNVEGHKLGECLYLSYDYDVKKYGELDGIVLEVSERVSLGDILFFMNCSYSRLIVGERLNVYYPENIVKNLEEKYMIPFMRMLRMDRRENNVKIGKIEFKKN